MTWKQLTLIAAVVILAGAVFAEPGAKHPNKGKGKIESDTPKPRQVQPDPAPAGKASVARRKEKPHHRQKRLDQEKFGQQEKNIKRMRDPIVAQMLAIAQIQKLAVKAQRPEMGVDLLLAAARQTDNPVVQRGAIFAAAGILEQTGKYADAAETLALVFRVRPAERGRRQQNLRRNPFPHAQQSFAPRHGWEPMRKNPGRCREEKDRPHRRMRHDDRTGMSSVAAEGRREQRGPKWSRKEDRPGKIDPRRDRRFDDEDDRDSRNDGAACNAGNNRILALNPIDERRRIALRSTSIVNSIACASSYTVSRSRYRKNVRKRVFFDSIRIRRHGGSSGPAAFFPYLPAKRLGGKGKPCGKPARRCYNTQTQPEGERAMKKWFGLLLATCLWAAAWSGCLSINAPEKVDVKADTASSDWNRTANKYASMYAGSDTSKNEKKDDKKEEDD